MMDMDKYKEKVKENIEKLINNNNLEDAKSIIKEYEELVEDDIEIYSFKGIIAMMEGNMEEAEITLKRGLLLDEENFDLLYNLAYFYELKGDCINSYKFYFKSYEYVKDIKIKEKINEILKKYLELDEVMKYKKNSKKFKANMNKDVSLRNKGRKIKVVFFPYKVSMWDSLETIYKAFEKDNTFEVKVVPIPYYQLSKDKNILTYEGKRFPSDIPITHYSKYDIKKEKPDVVFLHNIYDQYNTITRVCEEYFTSNIKKYTPLLIYVPYHIASFFPPYGKYATYMIPSIKNVDKIILVGKFAENEAIKDGIPKSKLITLGSPKFDSMVNSLRINKSYPNDWKRKIEGKTVFALDTGCMYFVNNTLSKIEELTNILNIPNMNENTVLIWRPHPLTKIAIMKYIPQLLTYYNNLTQYHINNKNGFYNNVILDESDNYLNVLTASDVLISGNGSLLGSYLLTGKKIIFLDKEMPKGSVIPENTFYYFYNKKEPWYKLIKKISSGNDPLCKNRKEVASKIYSNSDGTCGEKIYRQIKKIIMSLF